MIPRRSRPWMIGSIAPGPMIAIGGLGRPLGSENEPSRDRHKQEQSGREREPFPSAPDQRAASDCSEPASSAGQGVGRAPLNGERHGPTRAEESEENHRKDPGGKQRQREPPARRGQADNRAGKRQSEAGPGR